jgi:hypothetical protein
MHVPLRHDWPVVVQSLHSEPPVPHAAVDCPLPQTPGGAPVGSQQPRQLLGLHEEAWPPSALPGEPSRAPPSIVGALQMLIGSPGEMGPHMSPRTKHSAEVEHNCAAPKPAIGGHGPAWHWVDMVLTPQQIWPTPHAAVLMHAIPPPLLLEPLAPPLDEALVPVIPLDPLGVPPLDEEPLTTPPDPDPLPASVGSTRIWPPQPTKTKARTSGSSSGRIGQAYARARRHARPLALKASSANDDSSPGGWRKRSTWFATSTSTSTSTLRSQCGPQFPPQPL